MSADRLSRSSCHRPDLNLGPHLLEEECLHFRRVLRGNVIAGSHTACSRLSMPILRMYNTPRTHYCNCLHGIANLQRRLGNRQLRDLNVSLWAPKCENAHVPML